MAGVMPNEVGALIAAPLVKMRLSFCKILIFIVIIMNGCSQNDRSKVVEFLAANGIIGVEASNVVHAAVQPAVSSDYRNALYFAELSFSAEQYRQFLATNAFQNEAAIALPKKAQKWPTVPEWWNITQDDQKERLSKRVKNAVIVVGQKNNTVYLYGTD